MQASVIIFVLLGVAAQLTHVSAVKCSKDAECTQTDFTQAKCDTTNKICKCETGYVATNEGCAKKFAKPTVTIPEGFIPKMITKSDVDLTCGTVEVPGATYEWSKDGKVDTAATKFAYKITALTTDASVECQVKSAGNPALNSDKSAALKLTLLKDTVEVAVTPVLTVPAKVAETVKFTPTCSGAPIGATIKFKDGATDMPAGGFVQATGKTGTPLTCEFESKTVTTITFKGTSPGKAWPALATAVDSVTVAVEGKMVKGDITVDASMPKPTLICITSPPAEYLKPSPTLKYEWVNTGAKTAPTTNEWTVPNTAGKDYTGVSCKVTYDSKAAVEKAFPYKISVKSSFKPSITQTPKNPIVKGEVSFTCTPPTGVKAADVEFAWMDGTTVLVGQTDQTIQYTDLKATTTATLKCLFTQNGFSSAESDAKTLSVVSTLSKPKVSLKSPSFAGRYGDVKLECASDNEAGLMEYSWKKDDKAIKASGKVYSIKKVEDKHEGEYTCSIKFGALTATSDKFDLDVEDPGQRCSASSECDAADKSLTGECKDDRCVCAKKYKAKGDKCDNGVAQVAGSILLVWTSALIGRLL